MEYTLGTTKANTNLARTGRKGAIYFLLHVTLVVHKIATNAKTCKSERWLMGLSLLAGDGESDKSGAGRRRVSWTGGGGG